MLLYSDNVSAKRGRERNMERRVPLSILHGLWKQNTLVSCVLLIFRLFIYARVVGF
jgi:hypothetical protein